MSITSLWPVAFTAFCAANTAPQVSQYLPSVNPSSLQIAATSDRFLSVLLYLYKVPEAKQEEVIGQILKMDLKPIAEKIIEDTVRKAAFQ